MPRRQFTGGKTIFQRILVPIDGSHASNLGLEEAPKMAKDQNAKLCLRHVVDELVVTQNLDGTTGQEPVARRAVRSSGGHR